MCICVCAYVYIQASQNQFVVSCRDYIAFGASEDHAHNAIRVDNDLRVSRSYDAHTIDCTHVYKVQPCVINMYTLLVRICQICDSGASDTYQNEPLVPEELIGDENSSPFQVMDIEVLHVSSARRRGRSTGVR